MLFNTPEFVIFFLVILFLVMALNRFALLKTRNALLLVASYGFYAHLNPYCPLLLLYITLVTYGGASLLKSMNNRLRAARLVISGIVALSLLPLAFFKYAPLISSSFWLPAGLSFFTFQALSYSIDVYRGKIEPNADFIELALFIAFFPTLLSGPIERARNLLPQLRSVFRINSDNFCSGAETFIWGLFKKVVIADRLAAYLNPIYAAPDSYSGSTLFLAILLYSIQIYSDFSGYASMAVGAGRMMGVQLTENFNYPYFARTIRDFWHRWHISLTSWFTEYVYISLGGNRVSALRWALNILAIFIISGVWHGATWGFIIWGALHALLYLVEHALHIKQGNFVYAVLVFLFVSMAWVFFRVVDVEAASHMLIHIITGEWQIPYMGASMVSFTITMSFLIFFIVSEIFMYKGWVLRQYFLRGVWVLFLLLSVSLFGLGSSQFVYFQF